MSPLSAGLEYEINHSRNGSSESRLELIEKENLCCFKFGEMPYYPYYHFYD